MLRTRTQEPSSLKLAPNLTPCTQTLKPQESLLLIIWRAHPAGCRHVWNLLVEGGQLHHHCSVSLLRLAAEQGQFRVREGRKGLQHLSGKFLCQLTDTVGDQRRDLFVVRSQSDMVHLRHLCCQSHWIPGIPKRRGSPFKIQIASIQNRGRRGGLRNPTQSYTPI